MEKAIKLKIKPLKNYWLYGTLVRLMKRLNRVCNVGDHKTDLSCTILCAGIISDDGVIFYIRL